MARIAQVLELCKKLPGLLRGEHRRGLVENQNLGPAQQRLDDFHALLEAHRDVAHHKAGLHLQIVFLPHLARHVGRLVPVDDKAFFGLVAQHHVFGHRQLVDQHEVLMHHADAKPDGNAGACDFAGLPLDVNLPVIRLLQSEQHLHEGGFARAVFAANGVDFPFFDRELHLVVGQDAVAVDLCHTLNPENFTQCFPPLSKGGPVRAAPSRRHTFPRLRPGAPSFRKARLFSLFRDRRRPPANTPSRPEECVFPTC